MLSTFQQLPAAAVAMAGSPDTPAAWPHFSLPVYHFSIKGQVPSTGSAASKTSLFQSYSTFSRWQMFSTSFLDIITCHNPCLIITHISHLWHPVYASLSVKTTKENHETQILEWDEWRFKRLCEGQRDKEYQQKETKDLSYGRWESRGCVQGI